MVPSAFSMLPGSSLEMVNITVVGACSTVTAYAAATCVDEVIRDAEVGLSWVYIKSWSATTDEGVTISATDVNVTCDTAAVISPCVSRAASSGSEVVQLTAELQQRRFSGTAVITLAGDISFQRLTNRAGALPAVEVSCYTLVLRADPAAPLPPAVDMGSKPGIIRITQGNCPVTSGSSAASPSYTNLTTTGYATASLRLDGLVLHGLAPGPPSLYPYSLVTSMMWGVDTARFFGRANATNATNATASGLTTAAPSTLLEASNCTIVVDAEEHWMMYGLLAKFNDHGDLFTNAPEVFAMFASGAQVSGLVSNFIDPVTNYLRAAEIVLPIVRGLQGTWVWRNVTLHNALVPMSGRSLTVYGSPRSSASTQVLSTGDWANGDEYKVLDTVDVIRPPADRFGPEHLAPERAVLLPGSTSSWAYRLLLLNNTQVDVGSWGPNAMALPKHTDIVIAGDPVDPGRVHLDLRGAGCAITKNIFDAMGPYMRVNSLVLVNAGPLPANCVIPPPLSSGIITHLTPTQRAALSNWTSALWFFSLPLNPTFSYISENAYPMIIKNATLVLPDLEVRALVELATNGTTTLNIPPEVEALLARRLKLSSAPQARQLPSPPGALEYYFETLFHIHYMGYGVTLRPYSAYQAGDRSTDTPLLLDPSSQLLLTGGPGGAAAALPNTPPPPTSAEDSTSAAARAIGGAVGGAGGGCAVVLAALAMLLRVRRRGQQRQHTQYAAKHASASCCVERGEERVERRVCVPANDEAGQGEMNSSRNAAIAGGYDYGDEARRGLNHGGSTEPVSLQVLPSGATTGTSSAAGVNSTATHSGSLGAKGAPSSGSCFNVWLAFPEHAVTGGSGRQTRRSTLGFEEEPGRSTGVIEGVGDVWALAASGQQASGSQPGHAASDSTSGQQAGVGAQPHLAADPADVEAKLWEEARHAAASLPIGDDHMAAVEVDGVLGQGAFGLVLRGRWKGLQVAIKRMLFQRAHGPDQRPGTVEQRIMQEVAISASLVHANVVSTFGFHLAELPKAGHAKAGPTTASTKADGQAPPAARDVQDWQLYLVQELCEEGSLYQALLSRRFVDAATQLPDMAQVVQISLDVFQGLSYLHSRRLVHADVKPDNILLTVCKTGDTRRLVAKVADFGLSVLVQDGLTHVSGVRHGTPLYIAPEVMQQARASQASDIYAAGVVMWEMYHSRSAWGHVVNLVRNGALSPSQIRASPHVFSFTEHHVMVEYEDLATCCMRQDRRKRPTAEDCVRALRGMMSKITEGRSLGTAIGSNNSKRAPPVQLRPVDEPSRATTGMSIVML